MWNNTLHLSNHFDKCMTVQIQREMILTFLSPQQILLVRGFPTWERTPWTTWWSVRWVGFCCQSFLKPTQVLPMTQFFYLEYWNSRIFELIVSNLLTYRLFIACCAQGIFQQEKKTGFFVCFRLGIWVEQSAKKQDSTHFKILTESTLISTILTRNG